MFKVRVKLWKNGIGWSVKVICRIHCHYLAYMLIDHSFGCLKEEESKCVHELTKYNVAPRRMLNSRQDLDNETADNS